jgi:hypothetical protein
MSRVSVALLVLLFSGISRAQTSSDHIQLFGGFSFVSSDFTGIYADRNTYFPKGWDGSLILKHDSVLGLAVDVSGYYPRYTYPGIGLALSANTLSFLFGPQVSFPSSRVSPFAHALLGVTRVSYPQPSGCLQCMGASDSSFALALGGGIDFYLSRHFGVRGQADLFHNKFSTSDNQLAYKFRETNARISAGLILRF